MGCHHGQGGTQLSPPGHNSLTTSVLRRPINHKLQSKEGGGEEKGKKKKVSSHTWEKIPTGCSLQENTATILIQRPLETAGLPDGFKRVSTRSLLNPEKNKTGGIAVLHIREKQGARCIPKDHSSQGPAGFIPLALTVVKQAWIIIQSSSSA